MDRVNEHEIKGQRFESPHARTIKHLAAPWTMNTQNIWLGTSNVDPGNCSNPHAHANEEVFYVVSGFGRIRVGEEEKAIGPGECVYVPPTVVHQLINTGNEALKVIAAASPPFELDKFNSVHKG